MMELFRRLMSEQESENFLHSHDNSSREYLQPVVRYMRELGVAAE